VNMGAAKNFSHYWKRCVGSGHMLLATRADYQAHLRRARRELGFVGIRGHGILDDDMSVVPAKGNYEFFNIDTVYDFLLSIGVRPVVELSFMPKALTNCTGTGCTYAFGNPGGYKGLSMPPANYSDWYDLVKVFGQHLIDRYGIDEVSQWHFEVWNEFWGVSFPHPYMQLYKTSAEALKAVDSRLKVGGPASLQTLHVGDFVRSAQKNKIPFDFVSTHLYPTDPQCGANNLTCFERMILAASATVKNLSNHQVEFLVTEYNAGLFLQEKTDLDSSSAAAFIFRQVAALGEVDMLSWWTFTDIFEEGWMRSMPFQNGYGLMTVNGVPKPSWRAFELLAHAGSRRLEVTGAAPHDINSTLTVLATIGTSTAGSSELSIFVADWLPPQPKKFACSGKPDICVEDEAGSYTDLNVCQDSCRSSEQPTRAPKPTADDRPVSERAKAPKAITISILHGAEMELQASGATVARIDASHANPKALWTSWGEPKYLNATQIKALQDASSLKEEPIQVRQTGPKTSLISLEVAPNSVARILVPLAAGEAARQTQVHI